MKRIFFILSAVCCAFMLKAQDPQVTQFYASPTLLNPAFTGAKSCMRFSMNARIQWPEIPGAFSTQVVTFDHVIPEISSGVGLIITNDYQGSAKLHSTEVGFLYAFELPVNRKWMVRAGIQPTIANRNIDFNKLTFYDELARNASTTLEFAPTGSVTYFDVDWGLLAYSDHFWGGLAVHHMNRPDQSILGAESILPRRFSMQMGMKFELEDNSSDAKRAGPAHTISPAINYRAQGKFDQLDIGCYYNYKPLVLGMWYRGIPIFKHYKPGYPNNDMIAVLIGYTDRKYFNIAYSYDLTVSWLVPNAGGAHEISISYQLCDYKRYRRKHKTVIVPCPSF